MNFLVNYDLHKNRNYDQVYRILAAWKAVRLTESSWLVSLDSDAITVRDIVRRTLDDDDTVAVILLGSDANWATYRVAPTASDWLSYNVMPAQKAA
jgi:hypothetical protein